MTSLGYLLDGPHASNAVGQFILASIAFVAVNVIVLVAIVVRIAAGSHDGPGAPSRSIKAAAVFFALSLLGMARDYFVIGTGSIVLPLVLSAVLSFVAAVCAYRGTGRARTLTLYGTGTIAAIWLVAFVWFGVSVFLR